MRQGKDGGKGGFGRRGALEKGSTPTAECEKYLGSSQPGVNVETGWNEKTYQTGKYNDA